jgi:conjugal transfer pilus assembly protein TraV
MSARINLCLPLAATLAGCMNLSGLGGSTRYACGAPDGVSCQSVSATYAQGPRGAKEMPTEPKLSTGDTPKDMGEFRPFQRAPSNTTTVPLRTPPRILRLWFKPWEDADRDLVDQGYVYVQVDPGGWQLESWQRQVRTPYMPIRAPSTSTPTDKVEAVPVSSVPVPTTAPALPAQSLPVPAPQRP